MSLDTHHAEIVREARVAGLARAAEPSLDAVAGRRAQLWALSTVVVLGMAAAVAVSFSGGGPAGLAIPPGVIRGSLAVLAVGFCAYTIEKEVHLRRLTALLVAEQLRTVALQAEVDRLIEVDRIRSELLAGVRHDLRSPVESIRETAALLRRDLSEPQRASLADAVEREGRQLERMIDELLDAARLEREGPALDLRTINLSKLVRAVAEDLAHEGRPVRLDAPALEPVRASAAGLRRVVQNLIANAHTHGDPPVRVTVEREGNEVVLTVRDAGPGIPERDRRRVFEPFTRLDPNRSARGLGLGLAIVPGLAAAWGGRAWVDDAPEGGAAFHVALPRA